MSLKIHYHSDCPFFAGCEKMLVNFWLSDLLRSEYQVSFSYGDSARYTSGMLAHLSPDFPVEPLTWPPPEWPTNHFPSPFRFFSKAIRFTIRLIGKYPLFAYQVWVIFSLIKKIKPDIVHLNNGGYPAAQSVRAAAVGARLAGCKSIVMAINNLAVPYQSIDRWLDYLLDRWVVHSTTTFVTGSISASERLRSVLRLNESQIQPIHNGISLRAVCEQKKDVRQRLGLPSTYSGLVIGVVALMTERKGHIILIEALELLKLSEPNLANKLIVWFEGDGELKEKLEQAVKGKGLSDVVKFVGEEKNIVDLINAIDALILPSVDSEDFPNVTLEAMSLGKAVIASNLAGTPEQITDGESGYLVQPRNSRDLAAKVQQLIDNPDLVAQMGQKGKARFLENFTAEVAVDRYLKLYQSMIKR